MSKHILLESLAPQPLPTKEQKRDAWLTPTLHAFGIRNDTRDWHIQEIKPELVDTSEGMIYVSTGDRTPNARSVIDQGKSLMHGALAHVPYFPGSRREYSVFAVPEEINEAQLFAGYVGRRQSSKEITQAAVIAYPFRGSLFRMLDAMPGDSTDHFAVTGSGLQVPIQRIGEGILSLTHDEHRDVPLR